MKVSILKSEISVPTHVKTFALVLAMIDGMYHGSRAEFIQRLARYYGVTL